MNEMAIICWPSFPVGITRKIDHKEVTILECLLDIRMHAQEILRASVILESSIRS